MAFVFTAGCPHYMNIILGITGSISAYKTPWLVRDLRRLGHDVRIVMTPSATKFVARLALEATSTHPVIVDPYDTSIQDGGSWHVHLAQWANVMLIAPCSATTLSRLAHALCDTALTTVAFSLPAGTPLVVVPAMDADMWAHPATRRNVETIERDGTIVIPPDSGALASGLEGAGRLPEIATIVAAVNDHGPFSTSTAAPVPRDTTDQRSLRGRRVLITAGPTHEAIDDVRFVANASSGRMGIALAEAARDRGALVTLVVGPTPLPLPLGVEICNVVSAAEMFDATVGKEYDVAVLSAAVADFTPLHPVPGKMKKSDVGLTLSLEMVRTPDILATLGAAKTSEQRVVGFALEAEDLVRYATEKLHAKQASMIVANSSGGSQSGFGTPDNTITIITPNTPPQAFGAMSKRACAEVILDAILDL